MPTSSARVVGIAWYQEERYERIMALMVDGASFPKTHASWQHKAVRMERELKRQGLHPVRVELDPEAFRGWCAHRGLTPDSEARNLFVEMEVARQTVGSG